MNISRLIRKILELPQDNVSIRQDLEILKLIHGKSLSAITQKANSLKEAEFKVFSQWGDDGIIQYLISKIPIEKEIFIEFGVENYLESNTRFLLMNNYWHGLIMDGSEQNVNYIKKDSIYWRYNLTAKAAFVTAENINSLIAEESLSGNIGLLHIDIDGNDYWVWKNLTVVDPDIVIVEYNSAFGSERALTIPYTPSFNRTVGHYSNLYFGCSLAALCDLAHSKGYSFIGCNNAGNNAYFVKNGKAQGLKVLTAREGFVEACFRESRDKSGNLTFLSSAERQQILKGLEVINTRTGQKETY